MPHEIISLQIGNYANFVGAHFWNLQEATFSYNPHQPTSREVDVDVLYREGETLRGESTFTPRLVLCDYQGSIRSPRAISGGLYQDDTEVQEKNGNRIEGGQGDSTAWDGTVKVERVTEDDDAPNHFLREVRESHKRIPVLPNGLTKRRRHADYELEKSVRGWSDFLGVAYHPRSLTSLTNHWINDLQTPFDSYAAGLEEWRSCHNSSLQHSALEESLRHFVEECENMAGFQLLLDGHDGFGGYTCALLDHLSDEYGHKSALIYPLFPPTPSQSQEDAESARRDALALFNYGLFVANTASGSSDSSTHLHNACVPLSLMSKLTRPRQSLPGLPQAHFQPDSFYHTSAILAGAIDSFSLVYRLSSNERVHLRDAVDAITPHQRKVAAMSTMLPFPLRQSDSLFSALKAIDAEYLPVTSLTPHVKTPLIDSQNRCYSQIMSLRGVPQSRWQCSGEEIQSYRLSYEVASMSANRLFENFMSSYCPNTYGIGRVTELPCYTALPFPQFFSPSISEDGFSIPNGTRMEDVKKLPVMAGLHSTDKVADLIQELTTICSKTTLNKYPRLLQAGSMELDEYKESFERLQELAGHYREQDF